MYNPKNGDARLSGTLASLVGLETGLKKKDKALISSSIDKIILAHSIIMAYGGLPLIYSGDEIGLCNDYSYQKEMSKAYDNRWMHRPKMDWKAAKKRSKKGTVEYQVFNAIKKLIKIRVNSPDWADLNNTQLCYCENKHVLAFLRWNEVGRKTLVLVNFHHTTQFIKKDLLFRLGFDMARGVVDKYTGKAPDYHEELVSMRPYQFYWITDKKYYNSAVNRD
jgi:amylosucrase